MLKESACALAVLGGMAAIGNAQVPAVPTAGAPAAAAAVPGAPVAAAPAAPSNIWSFLCPTADQKAACKAKICNSQIGQLMNNSLLPVGALTGGLIGPFCPPVSPADLALPPTSAEGAAAQIKKDEADAKARRAAIRYLGTVDCHYWPEAQEALINGLRVDRNECVRYEAALALGKGCCCTKATIAALFICVEVSNRDGHPSENSPRVICAAEAALDHCLANFSEVATPIEPPKEREKEKEKEKEADPKELPPPVLNKVGAVPVDFYKRVVDVPWPELIAEARRAAAKAHAHVQAASAVTGGHSLAEIVSGAFTGPTTSGDYSPPLASPPLPPEPLAVTKSGPMPVPPPAIVTHTPAPALSPVPSPVAPVPAGRPEAPAPTAPPKNLPITPVTPSATSPQTNVVPPPPAKAPMPTTGSANAPTSVPMAVVTPANTPADPFQAQDSPYMPMPVLTGTALVPPVKTVAPPAPLPAPATVASNPSPRPMPPTAEAFVPPPPSSWDHPNATPQEVALHAADPVERVRAIGQLARCDLKANPNALGAVLAARNDDDPRVRLACLRAFKEFKVWSPEVVRVVHALSFDKDSTVRFEAMCILDLVGATSAVPVSAPVPLH
jgi:hypothetical protein